MKCNDANKWELVIQEELKLFIANGAWKTTPMLKNHIPISCKWVFCAKKNSTSDTGMLACEPGIVSIRA